MVDVRIAGVWKVLGRKPPGGVRGGSAEDWESEETNNGYMYRKKAGDEERLRICTIWPSVLVHIYHILYCLNA